MAAKKILGGKVAVVVAYDPAGPLFNSNKPQYRVDKDDAQHVQIIHTNGGALGMRAPIGDSDFYVNYGSIQYGCIELAACSHNRAYQYYAESICNSRFIADKCSSYEDIQNYNCNVTSTGHPMGGDPIAFEQTGIFYVSTNHEKPYAKG